MSSTQTSNGPNPIITTNSPSTVSVKKDSIHSVGTEDSYQSSTDSVYGTTTSPISPNSPTFPTRHESDTALTMYLKRRRKHSIPPRPSPDMQSVPGMAFRSKSLKALHLESSDNEDGGSGADALSLDGHKRKSSDRLKRTFSSDHLRNGARSASSLKSKALRKMKKSKSSEALHTDSDDVKAAKLLLDSCGGEMDSLLSTLKMVHYVEMKHIAAIKAFSSTIHSTIDLGPQRGASNTHYLGQYLKMMASSMHSVEKVYAQFVDQIKTEMIEPLTNWDVQGVSWCVVLKGPTCWLSK